MVASMRKKVKRRARVIWHSFTSTEKEKHLIDAHVAKVSASAAVRSPGATISKAAWLRGIVMEAIARGNERSATTEKEG